MIKNSKQKCRSPSKTVLPRTSLLTIYKSFIRPLLNYADVNYDQPSNASFSKKIESVHYYAVLAITETIKGSSLIKEDGREDCAYSITFFQLVSHHSFIMYYHQWEVLADMLLRLILFNEDLNISGTLTLIPNAINE